MIYADNAATTQMGEAAINSSSAHQSGGHQGAGRPARPQAPLLRPGGGGYPGGGEGLL